MFTRTIPSSGEQLPVLGLGTWRSFDIGRGQAERSSRIEVLNELFEAGGTVIDSSPMYGAAERVVGDLLPETRFQHDAFIATKVWTEGKQHGIEQMHRSMELLKVSNIDLMQIHNLVDWRAHLSTLRDWKEEGNIRYIGITHYTLRAFDKLAEIISREPVDFIQLPYSICLREAENSLMPLAADRGVAVIVNRPFEGGNLFGAVKGGTPSRLVEEFDCSSWGEFFLRYILGEAAVTCVIPATGSAAHMREIVLSTKKVVPDTAMRRRMVNFFENL